MPSTTRLLESQRGCCKAGPPLLPTPGALGAREPAAPGLKGKTAAWSRARSPQETAATQCAALAYAGERGESQEQRDSSQASDDRGQLTRPLQI